MTDEELVAGRAMLARKRIGWAQAEADRLEDLRRTVTKDALPAFQLAFQYSQTLPPRTESGLTTFYFLLSRGNPRCLT
jgi:hypothetical protein